MFFKIPPKCENLLRNNYPSEIGPKQLQISNILGRFLNEEKIIINPHGINMLKTINKDGDIYFGERLFDVIF